MTTAAEMKLLMEQAGPVMDRIAAQMKAQHGHAIESGLVEMFGRPVSAKRMRRLRRRGEAVRVTGRTATGKPRYKWLPRVKVAWRP